MPRFPAGYFLPEYAARSSSVAENLKKRKAESRKSAMSINQKSSWLSGLDDMSHTYFSRKTAKILYTACTAMEAASDPVTNLTAKSVSPAQKYIGKSAASK